MPRILAIDHGDRRFGLAMSDPLGLFARPLLVVEGEPALLKEVKRLIAEVDIELLVLGLPINMDGTLGPRVKQVLELKERLEKAFSLPVEVWDERLTTAQANAALRQGGLSAREAAGKVDKVAAQIILQSVLDRRCAIQKAQKAQEEEREEKF